MFIGIVRVLMVVISVRLGLVRFTFIILSDSLCEFKGLNFDSQ